jgi:hypothetical protein
VRIFTMFNSCHVTSDIRLVGTLICLAVTSYRVFRYGMICITNLVTSRSRVLLEKLTGPQIVKKFTLFYGTRRFITAFTSAHHLSLS